MRKAGGRFWILTILLDMGLAVAPVAADAVRFADINTTDVTPDSLSADSAVVLGSSVVFGLTATKEDRELLYRSDGTAAGTVLIQNLAPGVSNTIADMVRLGSIALFSAQDPAVGSFSSPTTAPVVSSGRSRRFSLTTASRARRPAPGARPFPEDRAPGREVGL